MSRYKDLGMACISSLAKLGWDGKEVDAGHWQSVSTEGRPDMVTKEIINLQVEAPMPATMELAQSIIEPNLPWAEDHFQERVGREPTNPGKTYQSWPWWTPDKEEYTYALEATRTEFKFTHTYQERFWPRFAGGQNKTINPGGQKYSEMEHNAGIRYRFGDLDDVVELLRSHPRTRQAYLPIFFPEDTGAVHGGRIPCTLGYHFLLRDNRLHLWYDIRSCDAIRHFRDDVYLAVRLCQWVIEQLVEIELRDTLPQVWVDVDPGDLYFSAHSFHIHAADAHLLDTA